MWVFHGETDDDFEESYNNIKKIGFYHIHTFKYSKRDGTIAATMPNQVLPEIQEERSKKIIELSNKMTEKYMKALLNRRLEVLIEEFKDGYFLGHTKNYILVHIISNKNLEKEESKYINKIINVKAIKYENLTLYAEVEN